MRAREKGFTLLEIAFSIFILGTSLVVLLGLQSSSVQRSLRARDQTHAMLIARTLLAAIETTEKEIVPIQLEGKPNELLNEFLQAELLDDEEQEVDERFDATLNVDYWNVDGLEPESLLRVVLTIYWGDLTSEKLEVSYFLPADTEKEFEEEDDGTIGAPQ